MCIHIEGCFSLEFRGKKKLGKENRKQAIIKGTWTRFQGSEVAHPPLWCSFYPGITLLNSVHGLKITYLNILQSLIVKKNLLEPARSLSKSRLFPTNNKLTNISSTSWPHKVENWPLPAVLWPSPVLHSMCMYLYTQRNTNKQKLILKDKPGDRDGVQCLEKLPSMQRPYVQSP